MNGRNDKCPDTKIVHGGIANQVVSTVESHNGGQKRPSAKSPGTQVSDFRLGSSRVNLPGETEIFYQVGLHRVENRHQRNEKKPMRQISTLSGSSREQQYKGEHFAARVIEDSGEWKLQISLFSIGISCDYKRAILQSYIMVPKKPTRTP